MLGETVAMPFSGRLDKVEQGGGIVEASRADTSQMRVA